MRHWIVKYTATQSFEIHFLLGWHYETRNGCFLTRIVQTFEPIILIYRRADFVYHGCECTSIYRPLSYPLRSLLGIKFILKNIDPNF